jgi:AGCS family alanine or glycine:cation symporter
MNFSTKISLFLFSILTPLFLMAQTDTTEVKASSFDMGVAVNINTLIHQCIDDIQANDWESANTQINESARLFSTLENSSLFDDSKIEELKAEIWSGDGLPSIIKFNEEFSLANDLSEDIRAHISSRDKDLSAKLVRDSLIHSNSVSPLLKSDSVSYEILESNWNNTIQALWYQSYIKYKQAYLYDNNVECSTKINEAWSELIFDNRIESYMSPITQSIEKVIFVTVTLKSAEKPDFKSIVRSDNSSSDDKDIKVPFVLIWLLLGAVLFTLYFKFINISGFKHAVDVVRGKFDNPDKKEPGEVTHFQALTAALSGTVGVGNIAGVAIAVSIGGPGATFWMIVAGLLGMSAKFVECTLGVKYRRQNSDGSVSGGPMYYLSQGLAKKGSAMGQLGKVLAVLFAVACIGGSLGGGNMVQINQATKQLLLVTGGDASFLAGQSWMFGVLMAVVVGLIIIGGIKSIAKVTDKVVPFMVGIYVIGALIVLSNNYAAIPNAFSQIIKGAFDSGAIYGGIIGVLIQGFKRAAFSNEAGIGSASIAHAAAKTDEPISEGMVSLLEPFIDTVVICTMTALVIVISGYGSFGAEQALALANSGDLQAIELTSSAFSQTISWFPIVLSVAVILFALSTMISWSYYGLKAWTYLFGESKAADISYKAIFCVFVVIGSAISAKSVFNFGDAMIFAMCFPNVLGLYILAPEVKADLKNYLKRVKSGEIKRFD